LEAVEQAVAVRADGREELIVDRRAHGDGGGARDGIAAERGAVVAGHESARRLVGDEEAADGEPVRERLREREEVGPDAELVEREERAGASDTGLHLVEGEQRAQALRAGRRGGDERGVERNDAALAEYRLE